MLSDGGVYDNLGLETITKRYATLLVSDAGQKIAPEEDPHRDWARRERFALCSPVAAQEIVLEHTDEAVGVERRRRHAEFKGEHCGAISV